MKLLYLYDDLMNLYGENGNIRVLERHLSDQGFDVVVDRKSVEDSLDFSGYDFIYIGSGTERNQKKALEHLLPYAGQLREAAERGTVALFTGNACEMLGTSITDGYGTVHSGLGLLPFAVTESKDTRYTGDAIAISPDFPDPIVGFINKCSTLDGLEKPLWEMEMGYGNDPEKKERGEGFRYHNFFGTHLIGPVLVKNPAFMKEMVKLIGSTQEGFSYQEKNYGYEEKAYLITVSELKKRLS